jgi:phosphoribosylglycinamide formyltransferase 1
VIGVLVSGEGTNLQALLDARLPVTAVASNVEGARALARAEQAGVPTAAFALEAFDDRAARDDVMADWLLGHGVELVVCAGYMQLLTPGFLERFDAVINVHPSLLPVDDGIDTGPVIVQEAIAILPGDTPETLHARLHELEHRLLPEAAGRYLAGALRSPRRA